MLCESETQLVHASRRRHGIGEISYIGDDGRRSIEGLEAPVRCGRDAEGKPASGLQLRVLGHETQRLPDAEVGKNLLGAAEHGVLWACVSKAHEAARN